MCAEGLFVYIKCPLINSHSTSLLYQI